jgi:6-pyruvoyltetrahydropterin/6-carboxytetrahydropterin synthase
MKIAVYRKEHFNAAHRLHNPKWTEEKNKEVFGKCNNPNYHGHNYELVIKIEGPVDKETGYVYDMKLLKTLINEHVISKFDHKNLNLDTDEFKDLNPTAENIALVIWNILRKKIEKNTI